MSASAHALIASIPTGSLVNCSDGRPRPPARFKRKPGRVAALQRRRPFDSATLAYTRGSHEVPARFSSLAPGQAVKLASEVLFRTLNAIAINPATRVPDRRVTEDRRFSLALTVAVPLSLRGRPARPERFSEVERRVPRIAGERGVTGPAGRALEAARLITCARAGRSARKPRRRRRNRVPGARRKLPGT